MQKYQIVEFRELAVSNAVPERYTDTDSSATTYDCWCTKVSQLPSAAMDDPCINALGCISARARQGHMPWGVHNTDRHQLVCCTLTDALMTSSVGLIETLQQQGDTDRRSALQSYVASVKPDVIAEFTERAPATVVEAMRTTVSC